MATLKLTQIHPNSQDLLERRFPRNVIILSSVVKGMDQKNKKDS